MEYPKFDKIRLDAFREISSMATGHAATSLSIMLDTRVDITVPNILVEPLEKVPELLGGADKTVVVVSFMVSGQVSGSILLVLSRTESMRLANVLTNQNVTRIEDLDAMGLSALKEFGNIITGSYIRVLADGLKLKISHTTPEFSFDRMGVIFDEILAHLSFETGYAVIVESEYIVKEGAYGGHIVFLLAPKALNIIIAALGLWEE
jgi:chemotaxis protein CheC